MKPLVSVIIPAYNAENTIAASIQSVIDQTFENWLLFIINDGATDNTEGIIYDHIAQNKAVAHKIHYIKQNNGGVSSARNVGLKNAKGDFIALLDSDDVWHTNKLEIQLKCFEDNATIDFLGANRDGLIHRNLFLFKIGLLTRIPPKILLLKNFFMTSSLLFKRSIVEKAGYFNEEMSYAEDLEYFVRVISSFNCYLYNKSLIHSVTNKFGYGDSGLSANLKAMEKGELKSIRKAHSLNLINGFEWFFISIFSYLKYLKRVLTVTLRN